MVVKTELDLLKDLVRKLHQKNGKETLNNLTSMVYSSEGFDDSWELS
jgi:hypothetical protein